MKRLAMIIAAAAFAFAVAGCGSSVVQSTGDDGSLADENGAAVEDAADAESEGSEPVEVVEQGEIAWSDAEDAASAAEASGFADGFTLPDPLPIGDYSWSAPTFNSMENVVDAHYDGEVVSVTVRKGEGVPMEELSNDLNEYASDWTQDCEGVEVACHGYEEGVANLAEWENEGCSYVVWCMGTGEDNVGMSPDEVYAMVMGVR